MIVQGNAIADRLLLLAFQIQQIARLIDNICEPRAWNDHDSIGIADQDIDMWNTAERRDIHDLFDAVAIGNFCDGQIDTFEFLRDPSPDSWPALQIVVDNGAPDGPVDGFGNVGAAIDMEDFLMRLNFEESLWGAVSAWVFGVEFESQKITPVALGACQAPRDMTIGARDNRWPAWQGDTMHFLVLAGGGIDGD